MSLKIKSIISGEQKIDDSSYCDFDSVFCGELLWCSVMSLIFYFIFVVTDQEVQSIRRQ